MQTRKPREALRPGTACLLTQADRFLRSRQEAALRRPGISRLQHTVLSIVSGREGVAPAGLSRRFPVALQTMNEIATGLERRSLLTRSEVPGNRRVLPVTLTVAGRGLLLARNRITGRFETEAFGWMAGRDPSEQRGMLRVLLRGPKP